MNVPPSSAGTVPKRPRRDIQADLQLPLSDTELAYGRFVPRKFLHLLGIDDIRKVELGQQIERKMTVLFSDIRDFTSLSEAMSPQENFNFLNSYLMQMEPVITAHGGIIDKYIGDAIMALFPEQPDDAVRGALAMLAKLDEYNAGRARAGYRPIRVGIGINTGIAILGTVGGFGRMDGTVIGDAVNLAARLERLTKDYQVPLLISEYTLYSLENPSPYSIRFIDRTRVRGKQDNQSVYEVFDADEPLLRAAKRETRKRFEQALACLHMEAPDRARVLLREVLDAAPDDEAAAVYLARCDHPPELDDDVGIVAGWREDYEIGVPRIDRAHEHLLADMNALARAVHVGNQSLAVPLAEQILHATLEVFGAEEEIMVDAGYPFVLLHARQHQRFFEFFDELRGEIAEAESDRLYLAFRVKRLLVDWLVNHILNADRHLGFFLRGRNETVRRPS